MEWVQESGRAQGKEYRETAGGGGGYVNFTAKNPTADWNLIIGNMCAEVFRRKWTDVCNFEMLAG